MKTLPLLLDGNTQLRDFVCIDISPVWSDYKSYGKVSLWDLQKPGPTIATSRCAAFVKAKTIHRLELEHKNS